MTAGMPQRPARTSQASEPREAQVTTKVIWHRPLRNEETARELALIDRGERGRMLRIGRVRRDTREVLNRFYFFPDEAQLLLRALNLARKPGWAGSRCAGSWTPSTGPDIAVWVRRQTRGPTTICIGRQGADGSFVGKPAPLDEIDFDALELAIAWLMGSALEDLGETP